MGVTSGYWQMWHLYSSGVVYCALGMPHVECTGTRWRELHPHLPVRDRYAQSRCAARFPCHRVRPACGCSIRDTCHGAPNIGPGLCRPARPLKTSPKFAPQPSHETILMTYRKVTT